MAARTGDYLKIISDGVTISNLKEVSMSINGEMIDVTNKDSNGWKEVLPGLKSGTMSGTCHVDESDSLPPSTIFTKISAGTSCAIIFLDITTGQKAYTCTGYYNKFDKKSGTADAQEVSFEITVTGAVTQTATT